MDHDRILHTPQLKPSGNSNLRFFSSLSASSLIYKFELTPQLEPSGNSNLRFLLSLSTSSLIYKFELTWVPEI
ncbi:Tropinone reductase-like protein [Frankliniella fusca]|uniref:Tropinone reductase-like protein n=1 Tax=Frankliniella fusca TaxID=407009 RepID=A0AAE1LHY7_9NEOP|nr:Tropinone reductase-like protein [Frankliniella fusca]